MIRVLVTGGSGFVGSYVASAFQERGDDVAVFDRVPPANGARFLQGDLTNDGDLVLACQGIDVVCHLGAVGDIHLAMEQPRLAAMVNVVGTVNVLEACRKDGVGRLVYASTWEVYGPPQYLPIDEEHPCRPRHPYSITKLTGEQLVLAFHENWGLDAVSLRLGTAYGIGMRETAVIPRFIRMALRGDPLTITGSGNDFRQFTHAEDIARGFVLAATVPGIEGQAFNLVASEQITVRNLAEEVSSRIPATIGYGPPRVAEAPSAEVSNIKAREMLGWDPVHRFQEGLEEMIAFFASCNSRSSWSQLP